MNISRAVLTLWYVTVGDSSEPAADIAKVLNANPKADRGFGRKYLSQLNPAFPVTPIGQFPLGRSAQADVGEFYIGGYPGVTVVQTVIMDDALTLSKLSPLLLRAINAKHIFAFASNEEEGYAGMAHWENYELKRSLCSTRTEFIEDIGLPEPYEGPYWAGDHRPSTFGAITLPFVPKELMQKAERTWLGVEIGENGPNLDVVGYAIDGRPEPKVDPAPAPKSTSELVETSAAKLGVGPANGDYDDYADPEAEPESTISESAQRTAHDLADLGRTIASRVVTFFKNRRR